jgi:PRTRC genetic system protein E
MFQQLVPILRQRSVLLTVTSLEGDQIRVNVLPKKLAEGENAALTTPMSFTGTAEELDAQLPDAIVSFVASHLELKNTLNRAKDEMAAAAKMAQDEARNKSKTAKKTVLVEAPVKQEGQRAVESPKAPSLFDMPAPVSTKLTPPLDSDEENEILAEIKQDEETEEDDAVLVASYSAG